jgi:tRNA 2-selenouridine synthase
LLPLHRLLRGRACCRRGDNRGMSVRVISAVDAVSSLDQFDTVIDARSPAEFAEDHLPAALNWPVLDDDERHVVGTEYKQISAFDARKRGAALVAHNIAQHIEAHVLDKPKGWRPLVYCWRGGQRSGTLAWFLGQIGFRTHLIEGGYKAFRHVVMNELGALPAQLDLRVVCGKTGSGKTRLLHALAAQGAQVLDLEALACHRGSVLGSVPGHPQPSQKGFDTAVWSQLRRFAADKPVFVESESKKIGKLQVPEALIDRMRTHSRCVHVEMPDEARLHLLLEEYAFFVSDVDLFCEKLNALVELRGKQQIATWQAAARAGKIPEVFLELMHKHYDPGYTKSMQRSFAGFESAQRLQLQDSSEQALAAAARELLRPD